jgi:hypothetical protein
LVEGQQWIRVWFKSLSRYIDVLPDDLEANFHALEDFEDVGRLDHTLLVCFVNLAEVLKDGNQYLLLVLC